MKSNTFFFGLLFSLTAFGQRFSWMPELAPPGFRGAPTLNQAMQPYYDDFFGDGSVSIFIGYGKDAFHSQRASDLYKSLKQLAQKQSLPIADWYFNSDTSELGFYHEGIDVSFDIQVGHEKNEWADSLANYEIVMYHGHSRYGRGPAFEDYSNYFRMGDVFRVVEVDTRNTYFTDEALMDTQTYPPLSVELGGQDYLYQYRGEKDESSYLPSRAYTKRIEGMDKDLKSTKFLPGKQILWLYSCSNEAYWKRPLRKLFPNTAHKFFFGTNEVGEWGILPASTFIISVATRVGNSTSVVQSLNATGDCSNCFTAY